MVNGFRGGGGEGGSEDKLPCICVSVFSSIMFLVSNCTGNSREDAHRKEIHARVVAYQAIFNQFEEEELYGSVPVNFRAFVGSFLGEQTLTWCTQWDGAL